MEIKKNLKLKTHLWKVRECMIVGFSIEDTEAQFGFPLKNLPKFQ